MRAMWQCCKFISGEKFEKEMPGSSVFKNVLRRGCKCRQPVEKNLCEYIAKVIYNFEDFNYGSAQFK